MGTSNENEKESDVEKMFGFAIESIYQRSQYLPEDDDERRGKLTNILQEFRSYKNSMKEGKSIPKKTHDRIKKLLGKAEDILSSTFKRK